MATGIVKWFNDEKGFGFITPTSGTKDVFVHHTSILDQQGRRTLEQGQEVSFEVEPSSKGPKAVRVQVVRRTRAG